MSSIAPAAGEGVPVPLSRRAFLRYGGAVGAVAGMDRLVPSWLKTPSVLARGAPGVLDGSAGPVELTIAETPVGIDGRRGRAVTINGTVPGPLLRFREGDEAVIHVTNDLDEDTSVHWHGILLPNGMDGVPGVNFPGIRPGETFTYRYPIRQYGTYWYHSHSGLQEQLGHYGPLIIDPATEPVAFDGEHVVVLSDWTFEDPYRVLARLKKMPDYHNFRQRTVLDFFRDAARDGLGQALGDRMAWGRMRMNPTDIADVTGTAYTYLMNGRSPDANWTGLFEGGERVRLRLVNASAVTFFDVRIPGLPMEVVQVSGQHVKPVETDELRIGVAERYDVIVEPEAGRAYTVFAEAMDRSGFARGTLAPREGMEASIPERRERPLRTMADMGMDHGGMDDMGEPGGMDAMEHADTGAAPRHDMRDMDHPTMEVTGGQGTTQDLRPPGTLPEPSAHGDDDHGPDHGAARPGAQVGIPMMVRSRLHEPGVGLGRDGWRVLTYDQLEALEAKPEFRPPDREIEIHLTGNMERFMWSMDGIKFSDAEPIEVETGERIRLTMVNDTMMEHPMHLHGVFMELENGKGRDIPLVDTVVVKPAEKISLLFDFADDAVGPWAFHCHILYHMDAGMFRVVRVSKPGSVAEGER